MTAATSGVKKVTMATAWRHAQDGRLFRDGRSVLAPAANNGGGGVAKRGCERWKKT